MNKAEFLLKDNEKIVNHKKNIIFLDIDGVIQPYNNTNRFKHDLDGTVNFLTNKYRDTSYKKMDKYDVCAAFYDWDEIGLGILKKALYKCNAYIVLHSGWREYMSLIEAKALFRLYDLEQELINICDKGTKEKVIKKYLEENKNEIDKYIVIDDASMVNDFGYHFIQTKDVLNMNNYSQMCNILNNNYEFIENKDLITAKKNNKQIVDIYFTIKEIEDKKVLFTNFKKTYKYASSCDYLAIINELIHYANIHDLIGVAIKVQNTDENFEISSNAANLKMNIDASNEMYYFLVEHNSFLAYNFYGENKYIIADVLKNINFK